ncbi:MAG: acyl-CoA synthetase [Sphingobacteriia bacterium]|jgi:malonyl-CoA/methylmalonyl-CoA synthetase
MITLLEKAKLYSNQIAILSNDQQYTYSNLIAASQTLAKQLLDGQADLHEARVAFMIQPGFDYVKVQWAIWQAGGVAVPLCLTHPFPSLQYYIEDTGAKIIIVNKVYESLFTVYCKENNIQLIIIEDERLMIEANLPIIDRNRRAMILYTSGTTNKPKGVVTTHANIEAQIKSLVEAWQWNSSDHIICVLPLHHVHGIINVIGCSLWSGAICEFLPSFSEAALFNQFAKGAINVFMAVPTIYFKLIAYFEKLSPSDQLNLKASMSAFRLMVCGSAALPVTVMEKWELISGHRLLERYGMTEIGMGLSNPYLGERKAGYVGLPLPGVDVMLANEQYEAAGVDEPGEILIKGETVFVEYWNNPKATEEAFTQNGWFKTGDIAVIENDYYRIMGRNSVDIIKSGGYKISALEIEEVLRTHEWINDCAVVGIPDEEWGELIVAALVSSNNQLDTVQVNQWLRTQMAAYKTPKKYIILQELPRNAMGKVVKGDVKKLL